jgi:hypothetical protein
LSTLLEQPIIRGKAGQIAAEVSREDFMGEIISPLIAGSPVTETKMFFGREDGFGWIQNSLVGKYSDHILVIHGQRWVNDQGLLSIIFTGKKNQLRREGYI